MIKLTKKPNLPLNRTRHCLVGKDNTLEISELKELGLECITLNSNSLLEEEISSHADILAFNFGNGSVLVNNNSIGECELQKYNIKTLFFNDLIYSPYPNDIPMNAAFIGNDLICNTKNTAKEILDFASNNNINIINTKQGYSKCILCVVADKAVITEDSGLACLLKKYQYNVLTVTPGAVSLSDKHYGFLGGASCKISKFEIYFSGNIRAHPDYDSIYKFLEKYDVKPIYNPYRNLRDFGGIIQLTEYIS